MSHHTKDKGDIACVKAIADITCKGYSPLVPVVCEHLPFDFVGFKDDQFLRFQAKYSSKGDINKKTCWNDRNGNHSKKYKQSDFDYYAIYLPVIDKVIYLPSSFTGHKIRFSHPNSPTPYWWWEDFTEMNSALPSKRKTPCAIKLRRKPFKRKQKILWPAKEELTKMVWEKPSLVIADELGVSDRAIGKKCKVLNIQKPPRGFWAKLSANKLS